MYQLSKPELFRPRACKMSNNNGSSAMNNNNDSSKYSEAFLSICARKPMSQSVSVLPLTRFNHLWTIKHFSYIPSEVEFICCPNFSPPKSKDKWFMKLRPKTVDEATKVEYIGIHLFLRFVRIHLINLVLIRLWWLHH